MQKSGQPFNCSTWASAAFSLRLPVQTQSREDALCFWGTWRDKAGWEGFGIRRGVRSYPPSVSASCPDQTHFSELWSIQNMCSWGNVKQLEVGMWPVVWKPFCKAAGIGNVACYMTTLLQRRPAAAGGLNSEMETHVRLAAGSVP